MEINVVSNDDKYHTFKTVFEKKSHYFFVILFIILFFFEKVGIGPQNKHICIKILPLFGKNDLLNNHKKQDFAT